MFGFIKGNGNHDCRWCHIIQTQMWNLRMYSWLLEGWHTNWNVQLPRASKYKPCCFLDIRGLDNARSVGSSHPWTQPSNLFESITWYYMHCALQTQFIYMPEYWLDSYLLSMTGTAKIEVHCIVILDGRNHRGDELQEQEQVSAKEWRWSWKPTFWHYKWNCSTELEFWGNRTKRLTSTAYQLSETSHDKVLDAWRFYISGTDCIYHKEHYLSTSGSTPRDIRTSMIFFITAPWRHGCTDACFPGKWGWSSVVTCQFPKDAINNQMKVKQEVEVPRKMMTKLCRKTLGLTEK